MTNSKEYQQKYYHLNKARLLKKQKLYRAQRHVKLQRKEYSKEYYSRPEVKLRRAKYWREYSERPGITERSREYKRRWRKKRSSKEWHTQYAKNKRANDIQYRIKLNLRGRLLHALHGNNKSASTLKLLGCSMQGFKNYLANQFLEGMSWSNYGKDGWQIDHKIPCAAFDLSDPEQQKRCFHYTNLQPLWALDNRIKGAKCLNHK